MGGGFTVGKSPAKGEEINVDTSGLEARSQSSAAGESWVVAPPVNPAEGVFLADHARLVESIDQLNYHFLRILQRSFMPEGQAGFNINYMEPIALTNNFNNWRNKQFALAGRAGSKSPSFLHPRGIIVAVASEGMEFVENSEVRLTASERSLFHEFGVIYEMEGADPGTRIAVLDTDKLAALNQRVQAGGGARARVPYAGDMFLTSKVGMTGRMTSPAWWLGMQGLATASKYVGIGGAVVSVVDFAIEPTWGKASTAAPGGFALLAYALGYSTAGGVGLCLMPVGHGAYTFWDAYQSAPGEGRTTRMVGSGLETASGAGGVATVGLVATRHPVAAFFVGGFSLFSGVVGLYTEEAGMEAYAGSSIENTLYRQWLNSNTVEEVSLGAIEEVFITPIERKIRQRD